MYGNLKLGVETAKFCKVVNFGGGGSALYSISMPQVTVIPYAFASVFRQLEAVRALEALEGSYKGEPQGEEGLVNKWINKTEIKFKNIFTNSALWAELV